MVPSSPNGPCSKGKTTSSSVMAESLNVCPVPLLVTASSSRLPGSAESMASGAAAASPLQAQSKFAQDRGMRLVDEGQHVSGAALAQVDKEIGMQRRNFHVAQAPALEPGRLNQAAGVIARRVLEHRAHAGARRLRVFAMC